MLSEGEERIEICRGGHHLQYGMKPGQPHGLQEESALSSLSTFSWSPAGAFLWPKVQKPEGKRGY